MFELFGAAVLLLIVLAFALLAPGKGNLKMLLVGILIGILLSAVFLVVAISFGTS